MEKRDRQLLEFSTFGQLKFVKRVLDLGCDVHVKDHNGKTALMLAARNGHPDIVKLLLEKGSCINDVDHVNCTALILAAYKGHAEVVKILLEYGADLNLQNTDGHTAMTVAVGSNMIDVANLIHGFLENELLIDGIHETDRHNVNLDF